MLELNDAYSPTVFLFCHQLLIVASPNVWAPCFRVQKAAMQQ